MPIIIYFSDVQCTQPTPRLTSRTHSIKTGFITYVIVTVRLKYLYSSVEKQYIKIWRCDCPHLLVAKF